MMDKDRIAGAATQLGGSVKDAVGGLLGDRRTHVSGKVDQVSGDMQAAYGMAKDQLRERPMLALLMAAGLGYVFARLVQR